MLEGGTRARVELAGESREAADRRPPRDRDERRERPERGGRGRGRDRNGRGDRPERPEVDEEALERVALDAAAKVRETGTAEVLGQMNSRERWVVHNALKDEAGVRSESEGEGRDRRVKLVPA
jgi:hypothetical protein